MLNSSQYIYRHDLTPSELMDVVTQLTIFKDAIKSMAQDIDDVVCSTGDGIDTQPVAHAIAAVCHEQGNFLEILWNNLDRLKEAEPS